MPTRRAALAATLTLPFLRPTGLRAQPAWPSRPVRLIVPFSGGGTTDVTARVVAERLGQMLGQPFVVDNRAGAGGNIGAEAAAKSDPDGYTLLLTTIGTASINQFLYTHLPYNPDSDFVPISLISTVANGVMVNKDVPANTLQALIALAKKDKGALDYGTPGNGTSGHLCGEYLKSQAGFDMQHVPYRGSSQVITDLVGNRVQVAVDNLPPYLPHVREGRIKLLAVTSKERWFNVPEIPTVAEAGIPGFEAVAWFGISAPARTPKPIVEKLAGAVREIVGQTATATKLRDIGSQPVGSTPEEFVRFIAAEDRKWKDVVQRSGARLE